MKRYIFLILLSFITQNSFCQKLEGYFSHNDTRLYGNGLGYFKFFNNNQFTFFTVQAAPKSTHNNDMLDQIGSGTYTIVNNKLIIEFKTDTNFVNLNNYDSIGVVFSSIKNQAGVKIVFNVHAAELAKYRNGQIHVETASGKDFYKLITDSSVVLFVPQTEIIKTIKFEKGGYSPKLLPFSLNFNSLSYDYYFKVEQNFIGVVPDRRLEFPIKKIKNDSYLLGLSSVLTKVSGAGVQMLDAFLLSKRLIIP